jgi:hypothetical protein
MLAIGPVAPLAVPPTSARPDPEAHTFIVVGAP